MILKDLSPLTVSMMLRYFQSHVVAASPNILLVSLDQTPFSLYLMGRGISAASIAVYLGIDCKGRHECCINKSWFGCGSYWTMNFEIALKCIPGLITCCTECTLLLFADWHILHVSIYSKPNVLSVRGWLSYSSCTRNPIWIDMEKAKAITYSWL